MALGADPVARLTRLDNGLPVWALRLIRLLALLLGGLLLPLPPLLAQSKPAFPLGSAQPMRYRLGPGDRLHMAVFKVEGYSADV